MPFAPFSTSIDRITAAEVSTPSTERSIEPIRMMKVAPIPSTSGIIAVWLIRTALPKLRKFGLITAMMAQSATSTASGAQAASRQRRGAAAASVERRRRACCQFRTFARRSGRARMAARPSAGQLYWICPLTRPQMSFQSSCGSFLMFSS